MAYGERVAFEAVREIAFGSITANYTPIGSATSDYTRIIAINNATDAEVYISLDGTTNHLRVALNSFKLFDFTTNRIGQGSLLVPKNTIFYIKRVSGAPTLGNVWIETVIAEGGK